MRVALVTEVTGLPDEGVRNWIGHLVQGLEAAGHEVAQLPLAAGSRWAALSPSAALRVRRARPDVIQYVPLALLTRSSLVRLLALRALTPRTPTAIAALQVQKPVEVPKALRADLALFASDRLLGAYGHAARRSLVVPPSVDSERFRPPADGVDRAALRSELGLPTARPLVLHVGHLRAARNLGLLAELARSGDWDVVMISSARYEALPGLEQELTDAGVTVIRRYVPDLERFYHAADAYLFPVREVTGAIEIPLTVLEAMACGTPVASARFGGLPQFFPEAEGLAYFDDDPAEALSRAIAAPRGAMRSFVEAFSPAALGAAVAAGYESVQ